MLQSDFLNRYKYNTRTDLLGGGGFGKVYRAYDDLRDRYVAVKIAEVTDGFEHLSLKSEAELSKTLSVHKNIAYYEDCFRFEMPNGLYDYGILQFYPAGNLSDVIKKGELNVHQKIQIAKGIINGLSFLHKNQIVHRDLKSSNILISIKEEEYIPKIADFGLSKAVENIDKTFKTNSFVGGSIKYSAPEQLLNTKIKGNVDIWSLGIILFELFVGKVPFDTANEKGSSGFLRIESIKRITSGDIPKEIENIPFPYRKIIEKCLIVDPDVRLQTIYEVESMMLAENDASVYTQKFDDDATFIVNKKVISDSKETSKVDKGILKSEDSEQNKNAIHEKDKKLKINQTSKKEESPVSNVEKAKLPKSKSIGKEFIFKGLQYRINHILQTTHIQLIHYSKKLKENLNSISKRKLVFILVFLCLISSVWWFLATRPVYKILRKGDKVQLANESDSPLSNVLYDSIDITFWNDIRGYIGDTTFIISRNGKVKNFKVKEIKKEKEKENQEIEAQKLLEKNDWTKALQINTVSGYEEFLQQFPESIFKDEAANKINDLLTSLKMNTESSMWDFAVKSNSISAYQMYLDEFPMGKNVKLAKIKIQEIEKQNEESYWIKVEKENSIVLYEEYLVSYPTGIYVKKANEAVKEIKYQSAKQLLKDMEKNTTGTDEIRVEQGTLSKVNNEEKKMPAFITKIESQFVKIPAGNFTLGCSKPPCEIDATPAREINLSSFYMMKYEVSQELYVEIMGENPSDFGKCSKCPVEMVSYYDITKFIEKINEMPGNKYRYRLPTEKEWEYAATGGVNTNYAGGNDPDLVAIYKGTSLRSTEKSGTKKPNGYGLYDMSGNVYEWCDTWYSANGYENEPEKKSKLVIRGGSWNSNSERCSIKKRSSVVPNEKSPSIGFRLVRN